MNFFVGHDDPYYQRVIMGMLAAFHVRVREGYGGICKTRENYNFWKKGKMVILVKIRHFSRFWMKIRTSPLESSREI